MWNLEDVDSKYVLKGHSGPITGLVKIGERKFASSSKDMSKIGRASCRERV